MNEKLKCPVCGKPLTQEEYDKALGLWKDKQEHIKHLEAEQKKLIQQQKLYEKRMKEAEKRIIEERKKLKQQAEEQLKKQRLELMKNFQEKLKTEVRKKVESEIRLQRKEFQKKEAEFKKTQSKMKQLEASLKLSAAKYEKANEEIKKLKEQLEKGITPQIEGLLEEDKLLAKLRELYPCDKFLHTGKGGDIIQIVLDGKSEAGKIVYELKKVKNFDKKHIQQTKNAKLLREADFAVLVTNAFPSKKNFYFVEKDVFVISPISLEPITYTLRESLIRISVLKLTNQAKEKAVQMVYEYLSGSEYKNRVNEIANNLVELGNELKKEISSHKNIWLKRYNTYKNIYYDIQNIDYRLQNMLQNNLPDQNRKLIEQPKKEFIQITELENK
jgi:hypothetical protein